MILTSCFEEGWDIIVIGIGDNLILLFFAAFLIGRTIEDDGSLRRSTGVLDDIDIIAGSFFNEVDSDGRIL